MLVPLNERFRSPDVHAMPSSQTFPSLDAFISTPKGGTGLSHLILEYGRDADLRAMHRADTYLTVPALRGQQMSDVDDLAT
jgi:hypothetical protein